MNLSLRSDGRSFDDGVGPYPVFSSVLPFLPRFAVGFLGLCAVAFCLWLWFSERHELVRLGRLACPSCGQLFGFVAARDAKRRYEQEVVQAYAAIECEDDAHALIDFDDEWDVVCPSCRQPAIYDSLEDPRAYFLGTTFKAPRLKYVAPRPNTSQPAIARQSRESPMAILRKTDEADWMSPNCLGVAIVLLLLVLFALCFAFVGMISK